MRNRFFIVVLVSGAIFLNACGVKGKPQPPLKKVEGIRYEAPEETTP